MNRTLTALLLSAFSALTFSQQTFANRPAMDGPGKATSESVSESEAVAPAEPSAVEGIMQRQTTQQTGDIVQLPGKEMQPGETLKIQLLDYPHRGMNMDKVKNEYGQPVAISDSVGQPPITRWTYQDRVVYFEYSTVLHVVAR